MSVTDLSVMVVDEFVPTETSYIVIRTTEMLHRSKIERGNQRPPRECMLYALSSGDKAKKSGGPLHAEN